MAKSATMAEEFKSRDFESARSVQNSSGVANPAPLGLAAFGITTFVLSCYHAGLGIGYGGPSQVVIGLALFYGGLVQLLAGMWEFKTGNTFGATAFSSYGGFWLSYATIFIPGSGVLEAYNAPTTGAHELNEAVGIYLLAWTIFTVIMLVCSLRQNIASILLFGTLAVTFLLLSIGSFSASQSETSIKAGGYTGILTAFIALYMVLASLATKENTYFTLPVGRI